MTNALIFGGERRLVHLSSEVTDSLQKHIQVHFAQPEACGVLIGSTSESFEEIYVESLTQPQTKDMRGRTFFFLKGKEHQRAVNRQFEESGGTQRFLGTWHTHPEKFPTPSRADHRGWNKLIKRNPDFPYFVFLIVGTSEIAAFVKEGRKFIKLPIINEHERLPSR